jgi:GTPase SAR1 family protein
MIQNVNESNILLCGSSRVGKSTLINAICQENLATSNTSLTSNTKRITRYLSENSDDNSTQTTVFWDTPGIDSWNENDVRSYMSSLIEKTQPICMIYCASPGSFASLDHLVWMLSECHQKNIFCALVCTNMWAGQNRQVIIDEFCRILSIVHPQIVANKDDGIIYYDRVALVTMVNSTEYIDEDFDVVKAPSGVDELIFGIGKCLQRDFMFAWLRTVSHNKSFWRKMSSKLSDLLQIPYEKFTNLLEHADEIFQFLFDLDEDTQDDNNAKATIDESLKTVITHSKKSMLKIFSFLCFRTRIYFMVLNHPTVHTKIKLSLY